MQIQSKLYYIILLILTGNTQQKLKLYCTVYRANDLYNSDVAPLVWAKGAKDGKRGGGFPTSFSAFSSYLPLNKNSSLPSCGKSCEQQVRRHSAFPFCLKCLCAGDRLWGQMLTIAQTF